MSELQTGVTNRTEADAVADIVGEQHVLRRALYGDNEDEATLGYLVFDRDGNHVGTYDVERYRNAPVTRRGTVHVHTPDALVTYARRCLDEEASTLWGDLEAATITVVLNDHGKLQIGSPGWADHRAILQLRPSPEWEAWTRIDGGWRSQVELAEFLEERVQDIVDPDGATLLEVARTFHATSTARFKSAIALHSGEQQLVYEQEIDGKAGRTGQAEIPREFTLFIRPFFGTDPVDVHGQFRFRVREGSLALGVRLLRVQDVRRGAIGEALEVVSQELALPAIEGAAPKPRRDA
ncbi:MAG: YfdQ family protein [Actinomycetota bacterium]|nr:YfdQ family protein [Actinomycetota bacterium]